MPGLAASIVRGIYRKAVTLRDVEVRFGCTGSQKMRPASVAGSLLRGIHRNNVMLYDGEVRFDRAGSRKISRCGAGQTLIMQSELFSYCNEPTKTRFLALLETMLLDTHNLMSVYKRPQDAHVFPARGCRVSLIVYARHCLGSLAGTIVS